MAEDTENKLTITFSTAQIQRYFIIVFSHGVYFNIQSRHEG